MNYILTIDQSTQGTKVLLLDRAGQIISKAYRPHRQLIDQRGYVSHDLQEIWQCLLAAAEEAIGDRRDQIAAIAVTNQRETSCIWDTSGPLNHAVVWQCTRGEDIARSLASHAEQIRLRTGLPLSPYFPGAKYAWLLQNTTHGDDTHLGTMDSYLVWKMTGNFLTDHSNASRTQLYHLQNRCWDPELCHLFGIPMCYLPEIVDSDARFGYTDLEGLLAMPVPVHAALGDSHAAMFAHGCCEKGQCKVTYGTGSSIMMNTGSSCVVSHHGLSSSIAWSIQGQVSYVLEGNINYSCAVITWLKELGVISQSREVGVLAAQANAADQTVLIPAFSGLSAPYWLPNARAQLLGMSRTTGRNELCRAAEESIALQISDILSCMREDSASAITELRADGGATGDRFLMQLQADLAGVQLLVPHVSELSALGAGYMAGIAVGFYHNDIRGKLCYTPYLPLSKDDSIRIKRSRWEQHLHALRFSCADTEQEL